MLGSISPLGERERHSRWIVTVASLILASTLAGVALGGVLGLAGRAIGVTRLQGEFLVTAFVALGIFGLMLDLRLFGLKVPTIHRQVNDSWIGTYRGWVYGAGFGLQLGLGVVTIVRSSAFYLGLLAAFLVAHPLTSAVIVGVFGLVRGASVFAVAGVQTENQLWAVDRFLTRTEKYSRRSIVGIQTAVLMTLLLVAL